MALRVAWLPDSAMESAVFLLVMMALALPFAHMQPRAGQVGLKVFLGIMLGILFYMMNGLFSHLGLLQSWLPFASAIMPSVANMQMT